VRWDRLGRVAMGGVLAALVYLYVSAGVSLLGAVHASQRDKAKVVGLERENRQLKREHSALGDASITMAEARRVGMARPGENVYVVRHLPPN